VVEDERMMLQLFSKRGKKPVDKEYHVRVLYLLCVLCVGAV
jgi:hypothetical protein